MTGNENILGLKSETRTWVPHAIVLIWLIYLGVTIWKYANYSVQPPLYDPLEYMQKAKNFWQSVEDGKFINPFDIEPSIRPPGTILMSYPFGFSIEFNMFHFRSVYLPILLIVFSVYIVSGFEIIRTSGWWVASTSILLSSIPMFYCFDWDENLAASTRWGLVDNFLAGVAAIAVAFTIRSLFSRSLTCLLGGIIFASFAFTIKPSGLMVMALVVLLWFVINAVKYRYFSTNSVSRQSLLEYIYKGGVVFAVVYVVTLSIAFGSKYLSTKNFAYAKQALVIMGEILSVPLGQHFSLFQKSVGAYVIIWLLFIVCMFLFHYFYLDNYKKGFFLESLWLLVVSLIICSFGVWYWLVVQAGGSQIRYFYPFILMGIVCVLPAAMTVWLHANRILKGFLSIICLVPAITLLGVLAAGYDPPISWQKWAGVSVSVGNDKEEVSQAYAFLNDLRQANISPRIYSFNYGVPPAASFEGVGLYERLIRPELPVFYILSPVDWVRGFAVRYNDMVNCDYILIKNYIDRDSGNVLTNKKIESFYDEMEIFEIWLSTLSEESGVEVVSRGPVLRLLRVIDRAALARSVDLFVSERVWRPEFYGANKPVWGNEELVSDNFEGFDVLSIEFENIYILHAISMNIDDDKLKVEFWWQELQRDVGNQERKLFFHLVDPVGNILDDQQIALAPYNPPFQDRRWRHGEVFFRLKSLENGANSLAFGIYQPSGDFLIADKGRTDWDGRRVLVPINIPGNENINKKQ